MPNPPQSPRPNGGQLDKLAEAIALTTPSKAMRGKRARTIRIEPSKAPADMTLLELVLQLGSFLDDDREVAETAYRMLERGEVRLVGNFRDEPIENFDTDT